jgi:hypothetical protein
LLYILLVGIPALAVAGILQLGQSLSPPASVGGAWQVRPGSDPTNAIGCAGTFIRAKDSTLTIVQSGPHLQLVFNGAEQTMLQGTIEELHITMASPAGSYRSPSMNLEADLDRQAEPDVLQGKFTFSGCTSQPTVSFTAVRQPAAAR